MKVIILEDDETLSYTLNRYFKSKGYIVETFLSLKETVNVEIVEGLYLVDVSLPDGLGYDFGKRISKNPNAFLIYLTAKDDQKSIIKGFETGSDDYITKPFSFEELDRRIQALLKRHKPRFLTFGDLKVDTERALVTHLGEEVYLSVQEYRILMLFLKSDDYLVSREVLQDSLNLLDVSQDGTLNVTIGRLRKKLSGIVNVEAVVRKGYKLTL